MKSSTDDNGATIVYKAVFGVMQFGVCDCMWGNRGPCLFQGKLQKKIAGVFRLGPNSGTQASFAMGQICGQTEHLLLIDSNGKHLSF